jgi:nicotinamide-nucleotide amidase
LSSPHPTDSELYRLAEEVGKRFLAAHRRLVTAESCTGGWIAKAITDVPGSSQWFEGGYVTYSNDAKIRDLKVSPETLQKDGAVSEATVRAMAAEALRRAANETPQPPSAGANVALSVSGIAGPDGGTAGKPVGTVWFGLALRRGPETFDLSQARRAHFEGDREAVRRAAVAFALRWLIEL